MYKRQILDHGRQPRNRAPPPAAAQSARGDNPLCGDELTVWIERDGDRIANIGFEGAGCALCLASASMLTVRVKGATLAETRALGRAFDQLLSGGAGAGGAGTAAAAAATAADAGASEPELGDLAAFSGASRFPVRVKCARLAWRTLSRLLDGDAHLEGEPIK